MTDEMSKDLIKAMRKKIKWLTAAVIILSVLFVGISVFAFSDFDVVIEYNDSQHVEQVTDGQSEGAVTQRTEMNKQSDLSVICGTVIGCVVIVTIGVVIAYAVSRKGKQVNERHAASAERGTKQDNDNAQQDTSDNA